MGSQRDDRARISRRGVLAATAGVTVGTGVAVVAAPAANASPESGTAGGQDIRPLGVGVAYGDFGTVYLGPWLEQDRWFTWYFDANRWSRISALPLAESPAGSSIEIVTEWANSGTLWVKFRNNSSVGVLFRPTVIIAPE